MLHSFQFSLRACDESGLPEGESILFTLRGALVEKAHPFLSGMKLRRSVVFISGLGASLVRNAKQPYGVEVLLRDRACFADVTFDAYGNRNASYLDYRDEELREETIFDSLDEALSVMDARYYLLRDPGKVDQQMEVDEDDPAVSNAARRSVVETSEIATPLHSPVKEASASCASGKSPSASRSPVQEGPSAQGARILPQAPPQIAATSGAGSSTNSGSVFDADIKPRTREASGGSDSTRSGALAHSTAAPQMRSFPRNPSSPSKPSPAAPSLPQGRLGPSNGSPALARQPPSLSTLPSPESFRPRFARVNAESGDAAPRSNLTIEVSHEHIEKEKTFMLGTVSMCSWLVDRQGRF